MFTIRNKPAIFILILMLFIMLFTMLLFSSCLLSNDRALDKNENTVSNENTLSDIHKEETDNTHKDEIYNIHEEDIEDTESPYDYSLLYSYRNISLNDPNKLQELVSHLQYAKELPINSIEFVTESKDYLKIDYRMNLAPGQQYKVDHTKKMVDVVILFALLDNLNAVEYNLVQEDYCYGGVPITREQAEEVLGTEIGPLGKTEEVFLSEMPKIIADLHWDPDVMDIIPYEYIVS